MTSALDEYMLLLQFGPAVLKSVAVLVIDLADPLMTIVWSSRLFNEMFGYDEAELKGQPLNVLLLPKDQEKHLRYFSQYQKNPTSRTMNAGIWVDGMKKDGTEIKLQVSLCPAAVGRLDMVIAYVVDVTKAYNHLSPKVQQQFVGIH